jgi:hypothetical protein
VSIALAVNKVVPSEAIGFHRHRVNVYVVNIDHFSARILAMFLKSNVTTIFVNKIAKIFDSNIGKSFSP